MQKVCRVIKFNQNAWLKPYIDMNTDVRKKVQNYFEKDLFNSKNNIAFGKTMVNRRKDRHMKLVTREKRRNYLVLEPSFHTTTFFIEKLLPIQMKKTEILMNKRVYSGLSLLELSKILMYEFWYDYVKPKYGEKGNLCYMDTDIFIVYIKTNDIYKDIAEDVETRFYTSIYELNRPLSKGENKK